MRLHYCAPLALAFASSAQAATPPNLTKVAAGPNLSKVVASVDGEYLSYSVPFGSRRIVNARSTLDVGDTKLSFGLAQGSRKAGDDRFKAVRASAEVVHDWSSRLSTRTAASIASNQPVFVTRELAQDISYKPLPGTVLTVGGRYARYWGGSMRCHGLWVRRNISAAAWSAIVSARSMFSILATARATW